VLISHAFVLRRGKVNQPARASYEEQRIVAISARRRMANALDMKKIKHFALCSALALIGLVIESSPVLAASFDCSKAGTAVEKMICSDAVLSRLDEELAGKYQSVSSSPQVKQQQRDWLRNIRNKCETTDCLVAAYRTQIQSIGSTPNTTSQEKVTASVASSPAHVELRVDCRSPDLFGELDAVTDPNLNHEIFGIRFRDWQPETVDQWQRQVLACVEAHSDWGDSLKDGMRQRVRATATRIKTNTFEQRKDALKAEATRQKASSQKLSQVRLYGNGQPERIEVAYRNGQLSSTFNCSKLKQGIGFATVESYRQAAVFSQLCVDSDQLDAASSALLIRQANGIEALYKSLDAFSSAVDAATRKPASEAVIRDLKAQAERLKAPIAALGLNPQESPLQSKIDLLQQQLDIKACEAAYAKTGMPEKWRRNLILLGSNEPMSLAAVVCTASDSGAQVHYLSGGFLGKEGFEVRSSNRTVQIFSEIQSIPGGDPAEKMMVPVQAQAFGKKVDIKNDITLRAIAVELKTAMWNK
jgi:uncharacterized protein YecT (DUF1311 family)